jgi:energy-coupling factor transporter ATP-binding protein EcfA2
MNQPITHIKSVHIKGLWGRSDANFDWELNADVNVLSGDNGSGKSTILRLIGNILQGKFIEDKFKEFYIIFSNGEQLAMKWEEDLLEDYINYVREEDVKYIKKKKIKDKETVLGGYRFLNDEIETEKNQNKFNNLIPSFFIANAETPVLPKEILQKFNDNINTNLDWEIDKLQRQFADYQITIGKKSLID